jgi:Ca2+-binding EF-hand superfamily protein
LGFDNKFFCGRIYEWLSQGKDLNKSQFLHRLSEYLKLPSEVAEMRIAFEIYDSRRDGKLTVEEIYNMFICLPVGSKVYRECRK